MWIRDVIAQSGILNSRKKSRPSSRKKHVDIKEPDLFKLDILSFRNKNVIISGDFFPTSEEAFKEKLWRAKGNVMPQMTSDTDILICGKYPDWMLIEEAKKNELKIIFVDKASDLFSEIVTGSTTGSVERDRSFSHSIPLGV